jgi:competence protein ComEA
MRKFLKEYFSFSRSEIRIIVILSALIIFSFLLRFFIPVSEFQKFTLTQEDNDAIDSFIQSLEKVSYEKKMLYTPLKKTETQPVYRNFDPNFVTSGELDEMGFPAFIRKNLIRYRQAGGKFREKSDLKKLYGFSDSVYILWEKYIVIPESEVKDTVRTFSFSRPIVELNSADSVKLLIISGIGPYFAGKIVNYRERLGGFLRLEQLLEIRGMDTVRLENIKSQIIIDTLSMEIINLNTATINDLKRHPYISPRLAESLIKYKQFAGIIKNVDELLENRLITEIEFTKLKPYITVGQ